MEVPQKVKTELLYGSIILLLGIYLKEFKAGSQRNTCTSIYCRIVHSSQEVEVTHLFFNEWINKM